MIPASIIREDYYGVLLVMTGWKILECLETHLIFFVMHWSPILFKRKTRMREPVPVKRRVAIAFWFLATPVEYRTIGHLFGVARCTVCVVVHETCTAIVFLLLKRYICFPQGNELNYVVEGFMKKWD
uniref:Transposase Helix-turn-helix domain-containing protein n=1 Tax=Amphimedon queenslandica TaxID=400682 RepID=A0A1X7VW46_AMPQE